MRLPLLKPLGALIILTYLTQVGGQTRPWPPSPSKNQRVVEEGSYLGIGQVNPKGKWLGLYNLGNGKYALKLCTVTTVVRPWDGDENNPKISIELSPKQKKHSPLFSVKAGLSPGTIPTVFYTFDSVQAPYDEICVANGKPQKPGSFHLPDDQLTIRLKNRKYVVRYETVGPKYENVIDRTTGLVIKYRGRKQLLESWPWRDYGFATWMGDLDGDGKLDVYVGVQGHAGYLERHLYLSSWAEPNEIVGRVGGFEGHVDTP